MKVRLTTPAARQAERMDRWWRKNREASPNLFAHELAQAQRLLAVTPEIGTQVIVRKGAIVRRLYLRKTKNLVYYEIDHTAGLVLILALWGAPKGSRPRL